MTIPIVAPGSQDDLLSFAGPGPAFRRQGHAVRPFARGVFAGVLRPTG